MATRFSFAFVLILTLSLAACGGGDGSGRGGSGGSDDTADGVNWPDGVGDTATPDTATPDTATPETTPGCDPACGAGFHCEGSTCVADATTCDPACGAGFHCVGTTCVADPVTCDPACGAGYHCVGTSCVADPVCDPACTDGQVCQDGTCVAAPTCTGSGNVVALKACAEGPADFDLTNVVVTYVYGKGYFVADASGYMQIYVGDTWAYSVPVVGDLVTVHVTEYGAYQNNAEVKATDALTKLGTGNATALILDISGGTQPDEANENRAVKGTGFTATAVNGKDLVVSYGNATGVALRVDTSAGMCAGTTFDLAGAVFGQFQDSYRIQSFDAARDLTNVDASGCASSDTSNWGFEEDGSQDPPADFEKGSAGFVANVSADQVHGGSHACALTWTSQDNQDFVQGAYIPIVEAQTAHFAVWVYDNDPAGRVRPSLEFFDAAKASLGKQYDGYSEDGAAWVQMTYDYQAPAGAAFVRAFVRLYDVTDAWTGTATVYVDDWSLTVQ